MSEIDVHQRRIRDESIVTGEAVELEVRPASPLLRAVSGFTDAMVTILAMTVTALIASRILPNATQSMARVYVIGLLATGWVISPLIVEVTTRGRSLGKWAFGLQVVRDDGGVVTARHSLVRVLVGLVELWATFGSVALITSLVAPRSKRLGDLAAGTMVVRLPEHVWHAPVLMPPDLAQWASSAQILPLPQGLHNEALGFLRGDTQLRLEIRRAAAASLAERLSARVAPLPPAGTDPERFIAAVLVVLRDREVDRTRQRDARAQARRQAVESAGFGL